MVCACVCLCVYLCVRSYVCVSTRVCAFAAGLQQTVFSLCHFVATHHENVNILEESAAIHWVMLRNAAISREEVLTDSELIIQIVTKLLELQHDELSALLLIPNKVRVRGSF